MQVIVLVTACCYPGILLVRNFWFMFILCHYKTADIILCRVNHVPDVPAVYGITRPVRTWNPIKINFLHFWLLIKDAWYARNWKDKFRIWMMPTGWRPADVAEKFPVYKIEDVYGFEKYDPKTSTALHVWSWVQLSMLLLLISYLFGNIASIGSPDIFIYGGFVFLSIYALTELMDRNPYAIVWETAKNIAGIAIIYTRGDWFGAGNMIPFISYFLVGYFILATVVTGWFVMIQKKESRSFAPAS